MHGKFVSTPIALASALLLVSASTFPSLALAAPDTITSVRARAHQEIAKRDALIAALQQQVAAQQKQIDALRGTSLPPAAALSTSSLVHDVQDYNLLLKRAQEADRDRSAAAFSSMNDFDDYLAAMKAADGAEMQRTKAEQSADDANTSRFSSQEIATMQEASKRYERFKAAPDFLRNYVEGDQCIPFNKQTPALQHSGAADLRFMVSRADLH